MAFSLFTILFLPAAQSLLTLSLTKYTENSFPFNTHKKTYCKTVGFCERYRFKIKPTH
jgi:hypothetical protein